MMIACAMQKRSRSVTNPVRTVTTVPRRVAMIRKNASKCAEQSAARQKIRTCISSLRIPFLVTIRRSIATMVARRARRIKRRRSAAVRLLSLRGCAIPPQRGNAESNAFAVRAAAVIAKTTKPVRSAADQSVVIFLVTKPSKAGLLRQPTRDFATPPRNDLAEKNVSKQRIVKTMMMIVRSNVASSAATKTTACVTQKRKRSAAMNVLSERVALAVMTKRIAIAWPFVGTKVANSKILTSFVIFNLRLHAETGA